MSRRTRALTVLVATIVAVVPMLLGATPADARPEVSGLPRWAPSVAPGEQQTVVGDTAPIHDPALIKTADGTWYVFSTGLVNRENGGTIQISVSHDGGTTWAYQGTVWSKIPAWIDARFADGDLPGNLWAPDVHEHDGVYYLYYSASRFGTDDSVTALATNTTLDPTDPDYRWVDRGAVVSSPATGLDPSNPDKTFNAIDANVVEDRDGTPYLALGSFWYGIFLIPISWPSGKPVTGWRSTTVNIADRFMAGNPIEAPFITRHGGWFYLFVSFDFCCQGADSTYKIAVGRSRSVAGPYLDEEGRDLYGGGGTVISRSHGSMIGTGGQSIFGDRIAYHYYDAGNAAAPYLPTLAIQRIGWRDGWPWLDQRWAKPVITRQPKVITSSHRQVGSSALITAAARGVPDPLARWQVSSDGGDHWHLLSHQPRGVVQGDRVLTALRVRVGEEPRRYRMVVDNAHGRSTSMPVLVQPR